MTRHAADIRRKGGYFSGDGIVQDFNSPSHIAVYLNLEIEGRGEKGALIRSPRFPHCRQHDIGRPHAGRLVARRHDRIDFRERLELSPT